MISAIPSKKIIATIDQNNAYKPAPKLTLANGKKRIMPKNSVIPAKVDTVQEKIGEIKQFSTDESTIFVSDSSSNFFPEGTGIYKISGTDVSEAIAVKNTEGDYMVAKIVNVR
jgi:hypothetical protein